MSPQLIQGNRAPVMTRWAAVVAERLGHAPDAALTLGKAVAGLNAHAKGRRLGLYEEPPDQAEGTGHSAGACLRAWLWGWWAVAHRGRVPAPAGPQPPQMPLRCHPTPGLVPLRMPWRVSPLCYFGLK